MTDSVWAMALALKWLQEDYDILNKVSVNQTGPTGAKPKKKSLADFTFARRDMAEELMDRISRLRFQGASVSSVPMNQQIRSLQPTYFMISIPRALFHFPELIESEQRRCSKCKVRTARLFNSFLRFTSRDLFVCPRSLSRWIRITAAIVYHSAAT